jgi:hypothetical protein
MADQGAQRAAIATALATVTGLRVDAEGLWPDRTNLPAGHVAPADTASPMNLTLTTWEKPYEVTVLVSLAGGLSRGQRALDDLYDGVLTALVDGLAGSLMSIVQQSYGMLQGGGSAPLLGERSARRVKRRMRYSIQ